MKYLRQLIKDAQLDTVACYEEDNEKANQTVRNELAQDIKDLFLAAIKETSHNTGYCERLKALKRKVDSL